MEVVQQAMEGRSNHNADRNQYYVRKEEDKAMIQLELNQRGVASEMR